MSDLKFDNAAYMAINEARWSVVQTLLNSLERAGLTFSECYDFGAGPGWFSAKLLNQGIDVFALEGRDEIVREGKRRAPGVNFEQFDLDFIGMDNLPAPREFSLAFGILYHLENPLRGLRIMAEMTSKALLLETMVVPGEFETARVVRENPNETQGIQPLAIILSEKAVERGLWATKIPYIYRYVGDIDHDDFHDLPQRSNRRAIWLASRIDVNPAGFDRITIEEPKRTDYWRK